MRKIIKTFKCDNIEQLVNEMREYGDNYNLELDNFVNMGSDHYNYEVIATFTKINTMSF